MSTLYLLIPLAVLLMVVAVAFYLWAVRSGQYEDMEGPAHRILMDDDDPMIPANAERAKRKEIAEATGKTEAANAVKDDSADPDPPASESKPDA